MAENFLKELPLTTSDKVRQFIFNNVKNKNRARYIANRTDGLFDYSGFNLGEEAGNLTGSGIAEGNIFNTGKGLGLLALGTVDPTRGKANKLLQPIYNKAKSVIKSPFSINSVPNYVNQSNPRGFLVNTASNPNSLVGTRYVTTPKGLLVPEKTITPDELLGSTIVPKFSDKTHRNKLVTSVSEQELKSPVLSQGGFEYPRDKILYDKKVIYASNKGAAQIDIDRLKSASAKNLELGGSGKVFLAPTTMGDGSEYFGGDPSKVLLNFVDNGKMTKNLVKELDDEIKKGVGLGVAMPKWKGIMTTEGREQLKKQGKYKVAFSKRMENQKYQKALGFNYKDVEGSLLIPELKGKQNTIGHTLIGVDNPSKLHLRDGLHPAYNKDIVGGQYSGRFIKDMPIKNLYGDNFMNQLLTGTIPNQKTLLKNYTAKKSLNPSKDALGALMMTKDGGVAGKFMDEKIVDDLIKFGFLKN